MFIKKSISKHGDKTYVSHVLVESVVTPAKYVESLRREAARRLLERSDDGLEGIAAQCGYGSGELLRRSFLKALHVTPGEYRQRFRAPPGA